MVNSDHSIMVSIRCYAFNQERYIRDCLDGFVMQQTNFRFEAIVHDDASSDKTAAIIQEYANKYPEIIIPILESENQYSKHDGSIGRIMDQNTRGKYIAICEGDDFWTDPLKLQKQFDLMEAHPEYSLCFHAHEDLYQDGTRIQKRPTTLKDTYSAEDIILGGGGFMATNSMFYRAKYLRKEAIPDFWKNCSVGDYPSMLYYASKGNIGYIDESMSVYRRMSIGSWSEINNKTPTVKRLSTHYSGIMKMLDEYDKYSRNRFHDTIKKQQLLLKLQYYRRACGIVFHSIFK